MVTILRASGLKRFSLAVGVVLTLWRPGTAVAGHMAGIRFGLHNDRVRVVLDLDGPARFTQITSPDGRTVTIRLIDTTLPASGGHDGPTHPLAHLDPLTGYRLATGQPTTSADVLLSAGRPVQVISVEALPPDKNVKRHRIVIDLRAVPGATESLPSALDPPIAPVAAPAPTVPGGLPPALDPIAAVAPSLSLVAPSEPRPDQPSSQPSSQPSAQPSALANPEPHGLPPAMPRAHPSAAEVARIERLLAAAHAAIDDRTGPPETAKAITLYRQAADAGSAVGAFALGQIYRLGVGVETNDTLAAFWYGEAAKAEYPPAEMNLGVMELRGVGLGEDGRAGLALIRRAARHGNKPAQELLNEIARTAGPPHP